MSVDTVESPTADTEIADWIRSAATGHVLAQLIRAVAILDLPTLVADGPRTVDDITAAIGGEPQATRRFLAAAAVVDLVRAAEGDRYGLGATGEALNADGGRLRSFVIAMAGPNLTGPCEHFVDVVRTGRPAAELATGYTFWEYYDRHPEEGAHYAATMSHLTAHCAQAVAQLYDLTPHRTIVDVGGAHGVLLKGLLEAAPDAHGVLYDRQEVIDRADGLMAAAGLAERVDVVAGDFLTAIPTGCDLYAVKSVLCDWDDEHASRILANVHQVAEPGTRLLVIDMMIADEVAYEVENANVVKDPILDFTFMADSGGRVRPQSEYRTLVADAGFEVERIRPFFDGFTHWHLLEAVRR